MTSRPSFLLIAFLLTLLMLCAIAGADQSADIEQGIKDLGNPAFKVREDAMKRLWFIGKPAVPALRNASQSDDPETRFRAKELLEKIQSGVLPNTPPEIEKKLKEFQDTYQSRRNQLFGELLEYEPDGDKITATLIDREEDPDIREKLIVQNWPVILAQARKWIVRGESDKAEKYIGMCADNGPLFFVQSLSAMALQRGTLAAEIDKREGDAKTHPRIARTISWLYRATGQLGKAIEAAKLADDERLLHGMIREHGDWKELAELCSKPKDVTILHPVERLGLAAAYCKLAGEPEKAAQFIKQAVEESKDSPWGLLACEVYLINDQPEDGEKYLLERKNYHLLGALYLAQGRMSRAKSVFAQAQKLISDEGLLQRITDLKDSIPETDPPLEDMQVNDDVLLAPPKASGLAEWEELARQFEAQWKTNTASARLLYLQGWALTNADRAKEGEELKRRAMLLPIGNSVIRRELIDELKLLGLKKQVDAQEKLLIRTSDWASPGRRDAILDRIINPALEKKDYNEVARRYENLRLNNFSHLRWPRRDGQVSGLFWHLYYSQRRHMALAEAALVEGKIEEAIKHAGLCVSYLPGDIDVPINFCKKFKEAGRNKDATALFERVLKFAEEESDVFPRRASYHNQLAWLCARCRRSLQEGLEHAKKAVSLEPKNSAYVDTLAEVNFQMGNKDDAIKFMKKCLELNPGDKYYESQMKRFKKGDPKTDPMEYLTLEGAGQ